MRVEDDKRVKGRGGGLGDRGRVLLVETRIRRGFELAAGYSRRSSPETNCPEDPCIARFRWTFIYVSSMCEL